MALRPLSAIKTLKAKVETGLVSGINPNMTPIGLAISLTRRTSSLLSRPAAGCPASDSHTRRLPKRIFSTLSATTPILVSATQAQALAEACVAETKIGVVADKVEKIRFGSLRVWESLAGQPAAGLLSNDDVRRVSEIASPMGVIFGLIPLTNPVSTFAFKVLIALKGRNAIILSCHREAQGVGNQTGEIIAAVLQKHNAPADLVQWVRGRGSRKKTTRFNKHPPTPLILATCLPSLPQ